VLIEMLEQLRGGPGAVRGAVDYAQAQLHGAHEQFGVFAVIAGMPAGPAEADAVRTRLRREWERRGLAVLPGPVARLESADWNSPSPEARRVAYKTPLGNPA
jgi:hypothetical protein